MSFFYLDDNAINLDHVKQVRWSGHAVTLLYMDGTSESFAQRDAEITADRIQAVAAPILPALPGFTRLAITFYGEGDGLKGEPNIPLVLQETVRSAIMGWRMGEFGLEPIANVTVGSDEKAVLEPSGVVTDGEIWWRDINEWADDVCSKWKRRLEYERKKREAA